MRVLSEYLGEFTMNQTFLDQGEVLLMDDGRRQMRDKRLKSSFVSGYESSFSHSNTQASSSHSISICSGPWADEDSANSRIVVTVYWSSS
jgi:hypothetical protein